MPDNTENLASLYYDELIQSNNPGLVLTKFYCSLFEKPLSNNYSLIGRLGAMVKTFGRGIVFYSVLDVYGMETVELSNVERIIYFFCKKRFIDSTSGEVTLIDLSDYLEKSGKKLLSRKTLKEEDPFK